MSGNPRIQILHSAEEHNLSPFDLNIACLCQSIEINNNKYLCMYNVCHKLMNAKKLYLPGCSKVLLFGSIRKSQRAFERKDMYPVHIFSPSYHIRNVFCINYVAQTIDDIIIPVDTH